MPFTFILFRDLFGTKRTRSIVRLMETRMMHITATLAFASTNARPSGVVLTQTTNTVLVDLHQHHSLIIVRLRESFTKSQ